MNPLELANISDAEARELQWRMDRLKPGEKLKFPNFGPLALCKPNYTDLIFFKKANRYYMELEPNVHYPGSYPPMTHLCSNDYVYFREFSMLLDFLRELVCNESPSHIPVSDSPAKPQTTPRDDYDINKAVRVDKLRIPKQAARKLIDVKSLQQEIGKSIMGQNAATETISNQLPLFINKDAPDRPYSVLFFGPSGTGKTEMAKAIHKAISKLTGRSYAVVFTDMNQYAEAHSVYRLSGAPPGYVGHDDAPVFEAVVDNPYTVFIFDELDKAHPDILKTFMAILDEGICSSRKPLADGSREYSFKKALLIFTSNFQLGQSPKRKIGFGFSNDVADIQHDDGAIDVSYTEAKPEEEQASVTKRIYRETEAARKAFISAGALREIASRFNTFVEFKELSAEAKVRILAKQVIETGFEYNLRLAHISSPMMQALIDASASEDALTVRSFKAVIEGYLAAAFADAGAKYAGQTVSLTGTLEKPIIKPS